MRVARLRVVCTFIPLALIAALGAGCAKRPPAYTTMVDPATGQQYVVLQPGQMPGYAPPQYQQQGFELYGQPNTQAYAGPAPAAKRYSGEQGEIPNRGLFGGGSSRVTYAQVPQPAPQAVPQIVQQQQPYVVQYQQPYAAPRAPVYAQQAAPYGYASAQPYAAAAPSYTLDSGDKLRITVFGQEGLTNSYTVDAGGNINMPLIGAQPARGISTQQLAAQITTRLKQGFVRDPSVSVDVEAYRPFFILGEVNNPGQYPYVANMTAEAAIAIAGGFSPRASKSKVQVTRNIPGQQMHGEVPLNYPLKPGDTVIVKERWF
jgi:polysaccharide export outer membrane protein